MIVFQNATNVSPASSIAGYESVLESATEPFWEELTAHSSGAAPARNAGFRRPAGVCCGVQK